MSLKDLLHRKSGELFHITPSTPLLDAIDAMCGYKVGALLVRSEDGQLQGILTERDILRFSAENRGRLDNASVEQAMTRDLIVSGPDCPIDDAMTMMTENRFRHLPILEDGKVIGIISIGDLVKAKLKDVTVEVKYLRDYINT